MSAPGVRTITVRHDGTERVFDSNQQITLGRAPDVTLFVDSPLVSRVHAILAWQSGAWVLSDNGSTNGVFVDARRVGGPVPIDRPTQVRLGDAISGPLLWLVPSGVPQQQQQPPRPQAHARPPQQSQPLRRPAPPP
ncbi:FHA domain-containing protein, partial [Nocardia jinanensis]